MRSACLQSFLIEVRKNGALPWAKFNRRAAAAFRLTARQP